MDNTCGRIVLLIAFICPRLGPCFSQVWLEEPSSIERCIIGQNKTLIWHYNSQGETWRWIYWQADWSTILTRSAGGPDQPRAGYNGTVVSSITAQHNASITLINCQAADFNEKDISVIVSSSGVTLRSTVNPTLDIRSMSDFSYTYITNKGEGGTFQPGTVIRKTDVPLTITVRSSTSPPVTMYVVDTSDVTQTPRLSVACSSLASGCSLTVTTGYVTTELQLVVDTNASDDSTVRYIKSAPFTPISLPVINSPSSVPISVQAEASSALNVLCRITGGPAPRVTWTYNGGRLPLGVESVSESDSTSGKLTTVNRRLQWKVGSTLEQRRLTGGDYTCTGVVLTETPVTVTKRVNVHYGPYAVILTKTSPLTVVENVAVTVTCNADCSPACSYQWTRGGEPGWSRDTAQLTLSPVRQDHNNYTCRASNSYNNRSKPLEIIVQFPPTMARFIASTAPPIRTQRTSLICVISSRPDSTISIKFKATGSVLSTITGQRAVYTFSSVHCLNTTTYQCTAYNGVGAIARLDYYLNVKCPVSPTNITEKFGRSLGEDVYFSQVLQANPFPAVSRDDWQFSPLSDMPTIMAPPNNARVSLSETAHVVQKQLVLSIPNVGIENYGRYGLLLMNDFGQAAQVQLFVVPEGPPSVPSGPQLLHASALSLLISWTAGFDGGFTQTFTVMYTNTATGEEYSQPVVTEGDMSTGDEVEYKLKDPDTVLADTEYTIRIQAENGYQGGSVVLGNSATFRTDPQPELVGETDPDVKIDRKGGTVSVTINLINPDSVSHMELSVCNTGSTECSRKMVTDLTSNVVVLPLPSTPADSFTLNVIMFDGDDMVLSHEWIKVISSGTNTVAIVGGVAASVLVIIILVAIIILKRRRIICEKDAVETDETSENRMQDMALYVNVNGGGVSETEAVIAETYEELTRTPAPETVIEDTYQGLTPIPDPAENSVYDSLAATRVNDVNSSDISVLGVFHEGLVYQVSLANPVQELNTALPGTFVAKVNLDTQKFPRHNWYLKGAAEAMTKLANHDNIIRFFSLINDRGMLLMEYAPVGNLRQYLTGLTENTYVNSRADQDKELIRFLRQTINGVTAVAELKPRALFYCLCCEHVLLGSNKVCKLTGFASAKAVKDRELEEEKLQLPRPVRWLAPEAIGLRHCTQSDVWGFGVLMWEILSLGQMPYTDIEDEHVVGHVRQGNTLGNPARCSNDLLNLLQRSWTKKPKSRLTLPEMHTALLESTIYQNL